MRRLQVHRPDNTIQAAACAGGKLTNYFALGVDDLDLQLAEQVAARLVVSDYGTGRRVVARKCGRASWPAAVRFNPLLNRPGGNERGLLSSQLRSEMTQRGDVIDDPDPAPVGRQNEIIVPRLDRQVPHRYGRDVAALELSPMRAAIHGDP